MAGLVHTLNDSPCPVFGYIQPDSYQTHILNYGVLSNAFLNHFNQSFQLTIGFVQIVLHFVDMPYFRL